MYFNQNPKTKLKKRPIKSLGFKAKKIGLIYLAQQKQEPEHVGLEC
jgi:hypothetical protein